MTCSNNQNGFTLVEISIVMVIIGLLLGAVMKGQSLILNANLNSLEKDLTGLYIAHESYKDRSGTVAGGNGQYRDNLIESDARFFIDLRRDGFITAPALPITNPNRAAGGRGNFNSPSHSFNSGFFVTEITDRDLSQYLCAVVDKEISNYIAQRERVSGLTMINIGEYDLPCILLYSE